MLIILIIIQFFGCVFSQNFINEPHIIQLGEYTNLICVLNYTNYLNIYKNNNINWFRYDIDNTNKKDLIANIKNGTLYYNHDLKKFKIFNIDNKIILQIKNITEDDKKYNFKCNYFNNNITKVHTNIFKNLTYLKFFNPFSLENIKVKYVVKNMKLITININFKKIFPVPKCFMKIKDKFILFENITITKVNYLYYQVNLNIEIKNINCSYEVEISCNLLKQYFIIDSEKNTCIYNNLILKNSNNLIIYIILIIIFVFCEGILVICMSCKKKNQSERKKILYSLINKTFIIKNNTTLK